jgi:hypothetical protein
VGRVRGSLGGLDRGDRASGGSARSPPPEPDQPNGVGTISGHRTHADVGPHPELKRQTTRESQYREAGSAADYLVRASHDEAAQFVVRYGDAALSALAARLADLTAEQRRRLENLAG